MNSGNVLSFRSGVRRRRIRRTVDIPALPKLPTDNFYKFKALAGVWIMVLFYVINWVGMFYLDREKDAVLTRYAVLEADSAFLQEDLDSEKGKMPQLKAEAAAIRLAKDNFSKEVERLESQPHPSKLDVETARQRLDQIDARDKRFDEREIAIQREITEYQNRFRSLRKDHALIARSADRVKTLAKYFVILLVFLGLQFFLGLKWAVEGFRDWRRLQNLEEESLRMDIERKTPVVEERDLSVAPAHQTPER